MEEEYKEHTIKITQDSDPENPREWDTSGIMVCSHRRYNLGDQQIADPIDWLEKMLKRKARGIYNQERLLELEEAFFKRYVALPLYLYDHSGLSISTKPFSCPWDSGQVGYIYITHKEAKDWRDVFGYTDEQMKKLLIEEVAEYDHYLEGDVYCVHISGKYCNESYCGEHGLTSAIENAKRAIDLSIEIEEALLFMRK